MENFEFRNRTEIVFGRGEESRVGELTRRYADRVLLHYGTGSVVSSGLYDRVAASLDTAGVTFVPLGGAVPNPRLPLVHEGIRLCRENKLSFILAIGGGSAIDSAKAIAAGVPYAGDVWDFFDNRGAPATALPVGCVLTIPAAGSEASPSSVITNDDGALKRGLTADILRPVFSILNPELTFTLPPFQTACGAADITAHIMERYFTNTRNVELTDRLCEAVFQTIVNNAPKVLKDPSDYDARAEIMWAGCVAHNDLLGTGRAGCWASHMIEHEISGIYDVAHGAGLSVVFPAWMKYVVKHDVNRFARFACRVWNEEMDFFHPLNTAIKGIARLERFYEELGLPVRLSQMNIGEDRLEEMARKCTRDDTITAGNFVRLTSGDVLEILKLAK